jgi:hypothetical protein
MVTHQQLVGHYLQALRHWERHPAVRELCESIGLSRRLYAELCASRQLDAMAWTTGRGLSGNAAYDDALALLAAPGAPWAEATASVTDLAAAP